MIGDWIANNRKLFTVVCILLLAILLFVVASSSQQRTNKVDSKAAVSKLLNRDDFEVTEVLVDSNEWKFVRVTSRSSSDSDNTAFAVLHNEDGEFVLKLGPGTGFTQASLERSGAPSDIQQKILDKLNGDK